MNALTREALLGGVRRMEAVPVPELGGEVRVRALTVAEQLKLEEVIRAAERDLQKITIAQLIAYACDEHGVPLFTPADEPQLLNLDAAVAQRIVSAAMSLHALDKPAIEAARGN